MHDNNRDQLLNLGMKLYHLAVSVCGEGCGHCGSVKDEGRHGNIWFTFVPGLSTQKLTRSYLD